MSERRDDDQFTELQSSRRDTATERRQVVLVAMADLLDETVRAQARENARQLRGREVGEVLAEMAGLKATDREFPAEEGSEQAEVVAVKEVEAAMAPVSVVDGAGQLVQGAQPRAGIIDSGEEVQVPGIGGAHQLAQEGPAVDGLAQGRELEHAGAVAVFHRTVVFEEGHVVGRAFDAQDEPELVVQLDGGRAHVMPDARALDTRLEPVADLPRVGVSQLAPEKGGDLPGLQGVDGGAAEGVVERVQLSGLVKHNVERVLHLHDAPVIARAKVPEDLAVLPGVAVQQAVQPAEGEAIGQRLRAVPLGDVEEGIVPQREGDARVAELAGEGVVAVEVELQAERGPSGDPEIAEAELRIDEVEVVVQALTRRGLEERAAQQLVVPGLEGRARFHGREDVHQARLIPPLGDEGLDAFLLPELVDARDELDRQPVRVCHLLGMGPEFVAVGFRPARVVEQAGPVARQVPGHGVGMADVGQRTGDHHAVKAGQGAADLVDVLFDERRHATIITRRLLAREARKGLNPAGPEPCLVPAPPG
jgi:hypothetical protein